MVCDPEEAAWLDARIAKTKELIVLYEDAITQVGTGGIQQYSLDTGQTRQMVTKANLATTRIVLESLENRLVSLQARRFGGSMYVRPGF